MREEGFYLRLCLPVSNAKRGALMLQGFALPGAGVGFEGPVLRTIIITTEALGEHRHLLLQRITVNLQPRCACTLLSPSLKINGAREGGPREWV